MPDSPPSRNALYVLIGVFSLNHGAFFGVRLAIALYAAHLGASSATIGVMVAIIGLLATLTAVGAGRWVDRAGARQPMLATSALMAAGTALAFFWREVPALFVVSALVGLGYNIYYIAQQPILGQFGKPEDRVRNFSLAGLVGAAAAFVAPLATGFAIDSLGHAETFLALALLPVVTLLLIGSGRVEIPALPARAPVAAGQEGAGSLLRERKLRTVYVFAVTGIAAWQMVLFLLPLYGLELGLSASRIGIVMGSVSLAMMASRLMLARAARRFGAWRVLAATLVSTALAFALLPLVREFVPLVALGCWLGFTLGLCNPLAQAMLYDHSPPGRATEALALWTMYATAVQTAIPLVSGAISAAFGMAPVFWALSLVLAGSCYAGRHALKPGA
jgi:MFS family permease